LRPSFGRFVYFLNSQGVAPQEVSEEHALFYREELALNEISKSPEVLIARPSMAGISRRGVLPNGPARPFRSRQKIVKLAAEVFSNSFHKDLDRLLDRLRRPDPLDPEGPRTPRKPATINQTDDRFCGSPPKSSMRVFLQAKSITSSC
jgi:hypothetical protein